MTITQRVEHLEDMMDHLLRLEERSLQIHADTRTQLIELRAGLAEQRQYFEARLAEQREYFEASLAEQRASLAEQREYFEANLAEQREDSKKIHRLWVRLAQKHGWIDDEDIL